MRLNIVIQEIHKYYYEFEEKSTSQAQKLLWSFQKKALKNNLDVYEQCPFNCNWGKIFSNRFNIENFPCKHTAKNAEIAFNTIKIDDIEKYPKCHNVFISPKYANWDFSVNINQSTKIIATYLKENASDTLENKTDQGFIFETISELYHFTLKKIPKNQITYDVIMEWANVTKNKNQQETLNVDFRSSFRCKMIQKYIESKKK